GLPVATAAGHALSAPGATCTRGSVQPTTLSIEGNLYAVVRGEKHRYSFGGSGPVVSSVRQALTLVRKLGFKGTDGQLLRRLGAGTIPGVDFAGGSGSSDFILTCRGSYRATALVRSEGRAITGTRFWLRQGVVDVVRAFCMPEQWVPAGALVSISFSLPLARTPPIFEIDWDGNGTVDSIGPFQAGGADLPSRERCG